MLKSTLLGDTSLLNVFASYAHTQRFFFRWHYICDFVLEKEFKL